MKAQASIESLVLTAILLAGAILLAFYFYQLQPSLALTSELRIHLNDCLTENNKQTLLTNISISDQNIYLTFSPNLSIPNGCLVTSCMIADDYLTTPLFFVNSEEHTC